MSLSAAGCRDALPALAGILAVVAALSLAAFRKAPCILPLGALAGPAAASPAPAIVDILFLEQTLQLAFLMAGAAIDARRRIIPNAVPAGIAAVHMGALAACALSGDPSAPGRAACSLTGGLAVGGGLAAFTVAYERLRRADALGGGDVKLFAALGFAWGPGGGFVLLASSCAAFAAGALAIAAARCLRGAPVPRAHPFCPAVAAAAWGLLLLA